MAMDAKAALEAKAERIQRECLDEVMAVCKRHQCTLTAEPALGPAGNGAFVLGANLRVVYRPDLPKPNGN
jgi:hypothetical protein